MRKCVLSFMHRALAGSVRAWAQMADEGARKAAVMGGALGRLRNRDWARALIQWVAYTDETLRVKGVLDGVGATSPAARRPRCPASPAATAHRARRRPSLLTPVPGAAPAAGRRRPPPCPRAPARSP